jgi:hypothetical protein
MAAKKKGPSMRENQQRKMTMQKIAKGGPQLSGVKKPAPSAGRRTNPKAAKPKPPAAKPAAKPNSRALANPRDTVPNSTSRGVNLPRSAAAALRERIQGPRASSKPPAAKPAAKPSAKPSARLALPPGRPGGALAGGALALRPRALGSRVAVPLAIASQLADIKGGFERMAKSPFIQKMGKGGKPAPSAGRRTNPKAAKPAKPTKPKPNMDRPGLRYEKMTDTQASRSAYGLKDKPSKPKPPAATTSTRASAPSRSSTPSRSSAPASRPAASRPSTPKPSSASSTPKVAATSGIGPVKSGDEYARTKGSLREQARKLREMQAESRKRQGK